MARAWYGDTRRLIYSVVGLYRLETTRALRSKRPLLGFATLVTFLVLMLVGFYTYAEERTGGQADFRYTYENRSYFNGLTFTVYAFYFGVILILPVLAATEGGAQLAGDTGRGTLRLLVTRPVSRARIYLVKYAVGAATIVVLTGGLLGLSLMIGLFAVGWGDLDLYPGVLQMADEHQHLEQAVALERFFLAWPLASLALLTPFSFSLMISSFSRNAVNAVGVAVALYLVLYVIAEVHFFERLRPWLFTSELAFWRGLFRETIATDQLVRSAARLIGFNAAFCAAGLAWFRRREER